MNTNKKQAIIFLDVDGVLTSARCNGYYDFDIWAVNFFLWVCKQANAKIVMSSAWRRLPNAKEWFTEVFGDCLHSDWRTGVSETRGDEVNEWLRNHPETDSFVIVDDTLYGLENHRANLVLTSIEDGMLTKHMRQVICLLGIKGDVPHLKPMVVKDVFFYTKREKRDIGYSQWVDELQERNARKLAQDAADEVN